MISATFENYEMAYVAYRLLKNVLEAEGFKIASEIKGDSRAVVMKRDGEAISFSYKHVNPVEVTFKIDGEDRLVEHVILEWMSAFLSSTATKIFGFKVSDETKTRISEHVKKIVEEIRKDIEKQAK